MKECKSTRVKEDTMVFQQCHLFHLCTLTAMLWSIFTCRFLKNGLIFKLLALLESSQSPLHSHDLYYEHKSSLTMQKQRMQELGHEDIRAWEDHERYIRTQFRGLCCVEDTKRIPIMQVNWKWDHYCGSYMQKCFRAQKWKKLQE